jgi:hypothetical protein
VSIFHETFKLHTYSEPSLELGKLYKFEVRVKSKPQYTLHILERYTLMGSLNWLNEDRNLQIFKAMEAEGLGPLYKDSIQSDVMKTVNHTLHDPKRMKQYNEFVWDNFNEFEKDVYNIKGSHCGQFYNTFNPKYLKHPDTNDLDFRDYFEQDYGYRTKLNHIPHSLEESDPSKEFDGPRIKVEDGANVVYVDSVFAAIALRERHIAEFFMYFFIIAYMKKTHQYPTINKEKLLKFLKVLNKPQSTLEALIQHLDKLKMIKIEGNTLNIRSQPEYVRCCEARYNAIAHNQNKPKEIKLYDEKTKTTRIFRSPVFMNNMTQGKAAEFVPFRPYFDILSAKTAKINCGFVSLIFGRKKDMRSFMYELVISSIGYPFCRTRIGYNLLLTPNTQRNYERCSKTLLKRHNYIQFSKHLVDSLSKLTRDKIQQVIRKGGKFKQTEKYIYRQEGNSFKNNIRWVKSEKASRLKLSRDILSKYKLSKVVFSGESKNPHYKTSRQSTPYAMFRLQMGTEFFAVKRGSCAVASNPEGFESFEPFFKYEKNGDFLIDSGNSISPSYLLNSTASS